MKQEDSWRLVSPDLGTQSATCCLEKHGSDTAEEVVSLDFFMHESEKARAESSTFSYTHRSRPFD